MMAFFRRLWCSFCLMLGNQPAFILYILPLINVLWPDYLPNAFSAKVISLEQKAQGMLYIKLKVSKRWPGFSGGQHIDLFLINNGRIVTRTFSLCSPVSRWQSHREIHLCCKVQHNGSFTPLLAGLNVNDRLNVSKARGDFVWANSQQSTTFIAAGSGITPIAAMLLSQRHWLAPVTLIYRVKTAENAALLPELQALVKQHKQFSLFISDSAVESAERFIDSLAHFQSDQYYLCGPPAFMQIVRHQLNMFNIQDDCIFQEQFGLSVIRVDEKNAEDLVQATFFHAGTNRVAHIAKGVSLLQGAEDSGLSPRFACRMGVCFQCVCQKVTGQVRDMRTGILSGHGEEQIQLCVSQPVTELVVKL